MSDFDDSYSGNHSILSVSVTLKRVLLSSIVLPVIGSISFAEEKVTLADEMKSVIEKAIPFIEAEGDEWITEKKCLSCLQITLDAECKTETACAVFC